MVASMSATLIVSWPFHGDRKPERHDVVAGSCLAEVLMELSPDRWGGAHFELYHGAITEAGRVPNGAAVDVIITDDEIWHVVITPAEFISAGIIAALSATIGVTAATIVAYVVMTAISLAISFAASMLLSPARQQDKATSPSDSPSAVNSLSPPKNTLRAGARIPEIYGRMRIWPDLLFPAWATWNAINNFTMDDFAGIPPPLNTNNNLSGNFIATIGGAAAPDGYVGAGMNNDRATAQQEVTAVYCLGRGVLLPDSYLFGDTDVSVFSGQVSFYPPGVTLPDWVRLPRPIANFSRLEFPGGLVDNPWLPVMDIPGAGVSEIQVTVSLPGGLFLTIFGARVDANASTQRNQILLRTLMWRTDDAGNVLEFRDETREFKAQTKNELRQTFSIACNPGRWRIQVAEVSTLANGLQGYQSTRKCFLEGIVGFERITPDLRTFVDESILVVKAYSQGGPALQNLENFNCMVSRSLPVLADVNGNLRDAGVGTWWEAAAINTLVDPLTCNYRPEQIDWVSFVTVNQALYAAGEWQFNGIFDRAMSADEQLLAICRKARCYVFVSNGKVTFARDERKVGVSALFNRRNRMLDKDGAGLGLRFPGPDDNDGVEISWLDGANGYAQRTYTYPEGVTLLNPLKVDLVGATTWPEIYRRARYEYAVQRYRRRTQPLRVTDEGQLLMPFDRVSIVAPWDEGIIAGEIIEFVGNVNWFRVDAKLPVIPVTLIRLRAPDGRSTWQGYCQRLPTMPDDVVSIDFTGIPFPIVYSGGGSQLGTLFNISLNDAYEKATQWLVAGVEIDDSAVTLSLMEDDDRVYQECDDSPIPPNPPLLTTY
jgi:hypothetical protein